MVIVRLKGGLGNQMFQYAAARALATARGVRLGLDLAAFKADQKRRFELDRFPISAAIASARAIFRLTTRPQTRSQRILCRAARALTKVAGAPPHRELDLLKPLGVARRVHSEPHFQFDPHFQELPGHVYLDGYWQSERYFSAIADELRRELTVGAAAQAEVRDLEAAIRSAESVGVHVRRGDYVTEERTAAYHGTCGADYYRAAAELVRDVAEQPHFFVFSDDPEWVRTNLAFLRPSTTIGQADRTRPHDDMRLLSLCRHTIIANSSFSWWGAWLNDHPGKRVVAPARWFTDPSIDTSDLIPPRWARIG
ncbi:MAG: alpha-1,2-fucosyltransferase [Holophagae bacterium]|nr:MAG: alpha-1,2-fucosyltransferase [Holophagae bacterium]